jgi:acetylornithine deacetylase/succinyl-diaminopimelate desuccinylase-like protein
MAAMGLQYAEVVPAAGHPVVYGERLGATGQPTVLIYGHYDVQPVDPLNEWQSPPFEPTIRGDNLYARGASDMKGQVLAFLKALEAWQRAGGLPVNVKVMVEGEEELGSPSLGPFLDQHRAKLACDVSLNIDAGMLRPDLPSLCYGLRGLTYFELWVHGPDHDLHSGIFGGSVHNPAQVLCEVIAQMHDDRGRVTLPGFYDRVRKLSKVERAELARVPHSDREWRRMAGAPQLYGEEGFTTVERVGARPTLEVHGLLSGFTGAGQKTVLPARAMAKISMRLVPHQDETEVEAQLRAFIQKHAPPTVRCEVKLLAANPPVLVQRDSNGVRAAATALEEAFGAQPSFVLGGGSIPVVSLVQAKLGVDSIMTGFGLPDDNLHAPNEKQHLPTWYRGIEALIRFLALLAR